MSMFGMPAFDAETGLVRYYPAIDGGRRRRAWVEVNVEPVLTDSVLANPAVRTAVLVAVGHLRLSDTRPEQLYLMLVVSERDDVELSELAYAARSDRGPADGSGFAAKVIRTWHGDELGALFGCCCREPMGSDNKTVVAILQPDPRYPRQIEVGLDPQRRLPRPWLDGVIDVGAEPLYAFAPDDAGRRRDLYLRTQIEPRVRKRFADHPQLRSTAVTFAQYHDDQALDEVHVRLVHSELDTPDLSSENAWYGFLRDEINLPSVGRQPDAHGDQSYRAIALFAPFCTEGGSPDELHFRNYSPYAVMRRVGDSLLTEVVGVMYRPWLEGRLSWDAASAVERGEVDPFDEAGDAWLQEPVDPDEPR